MLRQRFDLKHDLHNTNLRLNKIRVNQAKFNYKAGQSKNTQLGGLKVTA